jgi:hypothetical protein
LITNMPIPPFGLIIELITVLAGIGAAAMHVRDVIYISRLAPASLRPIPTGTTAITTPPPPPPEDFEVAPGMENLPDGFRGFEEEW